MGLFGKKQQSTAPPLAERDKAVKFYQGAYPIGQEIKQVGDDFNTFLQQFSQQKVTNQEIVGIIQESTERLEALSTDLSVLYAPPPLRQLKDDIAKAINLGIKAFSSYKIGAETYNISYFQKGDEEALEVERLMMHTAKEWDDGLAHYKIKPSEVLP